MRWMPPGNWVSPLPTFLIAAGLTVAIPAVIFHRMYQRRIDELVVDMEQEAVKLVDVFHGERGKSAIDGETAGV